MSGIRRGTRRSGPRRRIRRDLAEYLAGRSVWPSRAEFERAGLTQLRNAVNRTGGPDRWAAEFGLPRQNRLSGIRRGWTREAIEATLTGFIGDADMWPTRREFEQAGLSGLLTAHLQQGRSGLLGAPLQGSPPTRGVAGSPRGLDRSANPAGPRGVLRRPRGLADGTRIPGGRQRRAVSRRESHRRHRLLG